ncbi:hypothetical protein ELUMI_v1c07720 [Williamsoniiplasma luminosum]|uniref:Uncharacterized protein n=1 Tax=Williamsoniiplasma luminosum TaxID=214888 RepID=A0A2K8NUQ3_9MOLU|nr:hypothetical protein [Williamsoniiplasma luminosum]ATZ17494.1 hypothetical protein ELUMI_v1c07720 [Williamsoniiplasma luminosum]
MKKDNIRASLKKYRASQKQVHAQEVEEILQDTYDASDQNAKVYFYRQNKKLRWWGWVLPWVFALVATGLSFLIGWLLYNDVNLNGINGGWHGVGWVSLSFLIAFVFAYMVLSWFRNRAAAKYFNHKARRYQYTLTEWEAKIIVWKKIVFLTCLPLILVTGLTIGLL